MPVFISSRPRVFVPDSAYKRSCNFHLISSKTESKSFLGVVIKLRLDFVFIWGWRFRDAGIFLMVTLWWNHTCCRNRVLWSWQFIEERHDHRTCRKGWSFSWGSDLPWRRNRASWTWMHWWDWNRSRCSWRLWWTWNFFYCFLITNVCIDHFFQNN